MISELLASPNGKIMTLFAKYASQMANLTDIG